MRILVVGGAGYIGSHMVKMLLDTGQSTVTLDNLVNGHRDAVLGGEFVFGDLSDAALLDGLFRSYTFDAVMHFASFIQVGESVKDPAKYYQNNVACTLNLLDAMVTHGVRKLIFSSTAAIFGDPCYTPIDEAHSRKPINPYGRSKLMVEQVLADYDLAYGLKSVCLRYFNAAGADPDGLLGERHNPETHLIPLVLQAASGRRESISVYGDNYATPDGSCIRDYIHVSDLCEAHFLALEYLLDRGNSAAYNLGNGKGFSVYEVIDSARRVTGKTINVVRASRRDGDPVVLVACSSLAQEVLGWKPKHSELDVIVGHAWQWEQGCGKSGLSHG